MERLLRNPAGFLESGVPGDDIAISCRVRLARNIAGRDFPNAAPDEARRELCSLVEAAAPEFATLGGADALCFSFILSSLIYFSFLLFPSRLPGQK